MGWHKRNEDLTSFEPRVWLSTPTMHGAEMQYICDAYKSNWMSTVGENINCVETEIAALMGCRQAVALTTGTSALHMAVKVAGIHPGDRVFCSDLTFAATANAILYAGGVPIFIDSEYETWNMDPNALKRAFDLYPEVKAVVLVHLFGVPGKVDEIKSICNAHNAVLIEDAAESLGSLYKGMHPGCIGDVGILSFNGNKIITGSSGGMLLTNDESAADRVRKWSAQSREDAPWYQHEEIGYNYRMSNLIAGVIRGQLPYLEEHVTRKCEIYTRYQNGFAELPVKMNPFDSETSQPNYWLSCLLIDHDAMSQCVLTESQASYEPEPGKSCPMEIIDMLAEYNAEARPIWKPMHMQPVFGNFDFVTAEENSPAVSTDVFLRGLCLPSDIKMTPEQQDKVIEMICSCFN